jgi:hypothetical protein
VCERAPVRNKKTEPKERAEREKKTQEPKPPTPDTNQTNTNQEPSPKTSKPEAEALRTRSLDPCQIRRSYGKDPPATRKKIKKNLVALLVNALDP